MYMMDKYVYCSYRILPRSKIWEMFFKLIKIFLFQSWHFTVNLELVLAVYNGLSCLRRMLSVMNNTACSDSHSKHNLPKIEHMHTHAMSHKTGAWGGISHLCALDTLPSGSRKVSWLKSCPRYINPTREVLLCCIATLTLYAWWNVTYEQRKIHRFCELLLFVCYIAC